MEFAQLFLERHAVIYDLRMEDIWKSVPKDRMRPRPHPGVNSIAWIIWHLTRVEDAGLNRFVADRAQVLDEGGWMERMNLPWRNNGGGMTFAEVEALSERIDLQALHDYSRAVQARTREIVSQTAQVDLDATLGTERLRLILVNEGLAHSQAERLIDWYAGWSKGKCMMNFGLTHPFQHLGEMGIIASLLGVVEE
jgi:hypothetical protein